MDLSAITPFVLTLDEEPNIGRALDGLRWAGRVLVVDSGSADRTVEIASSYPNVEVHSRAFDSPAGQSNYALAGVDTPWAMALDADYVVPPALVEEIAALPAEPAESGFFAPFEYVILGRKLRGSLYPPRQVLFRKELAAFEQDGHTQRVRVLGQRLAPHPDPPRRPQESEALAAEPAMYAERRRPSWPPPRCASWGGPIACARRWCWALPPSRCTACSRGGWSSTGEPAWTIRRSER